MPRLVAIQALRALAALSVAILHVLHEGRLLQGHGVSGSAVGQLPWEAGVDVFFVVSGFVMVFASRSLFEQPGARVRFVAHRLARVVPLYWLATALYLVVALVRPGAVGVAAPSPGYVAASFLFWPMARPDGTVVPLFSLGWTLNYELFFYALFALALGFGPRIAVALVTTLLLLTMAVAAMGAPLPVSFWGASIVLEFAFGMMLGLVWLEGVRLGTVARSALAMAGLALFAAWGTDAALPRAVLYGLPAALLVAAAALAPIGSPARVSAPVRLLSLLGDASYALYLTHPFAIRGLREIWMQAPSTLPEPLFGTAGIAMAIAVAVAVHLFVEKPLVGLARPWLERRLTR